MQNRRIRDNRTRVLFFLNNSKLAKQINNGPKIQKIPTHSKTITIVIGIRLQFRRAFRGNNLSHKPCKFTVQKTSQPVEPTGAFPAILNRREGFNGVILYQHPFFLL
jgi:hypothetical protein